MNNQPQPIAHTSIRTADEHTRLVNVECTIAASNEIRKYFMDWDQIGPTLYEGKVSRLYKFDDVIDFIKAWRPSE